jgi:hypothetical protein
LDKEALDLRAELQKAKEEFELDVLQQEMKNRSRIRKVADVGRRIIATSRAVTSGIDDSFTGIQAYVAMLANPKEGVKAWKEHALDAVSEKRFQRNLAAIHNSPYWKLIQESGLDILEPQSLTASKVEEMMAGSYHNEAIRWKGKEVTVKIKGKDVPVKPLAFLRPFEIAFTSLGNNLRYDLFTKQAEALMDAGKTFETHPDEFKSLASAVNNITGRGGLPMPVSLASPIITPVIWSPRLISSSLNLLGVSDVFMPIIGEKGFYAKMTPEQRAYVAGNMARAISVGIVVIAGFKIANMSGADTDVDVDPRSVTFGNVRVGNKSYNVFGRFSPYVKLITQAGLSRLYSKATGDDWKPQRVKDGEVQFLDDGKSPYRPTTWKTIGGFSRGKMTPAAGAVYDLIAGEGYFDRQPYGLKEAGRDLVMPLSMKDVTKNMERDPITMQMLNFLLSFEGVKVSDQRDFEKEVKATSGKPQAPQAPKAPEAPTAPE